MKRKFPPFFLALMLAVPLCGSLRASVPVGIEGKLTVRLPSGLSAAPLKEQADVVLRIARVSRIDDRQSEYDLRYIVMEKGSHDLRNYLQTSDGKAVSAELLPDAIQVEATSALPDDFDGTLMAFAPTPLPKAVHYWRWVTALGIFWALALVPILLMGRKKKLVILKPDLEVLEPPVLTTIQKLRGLVNQVELNSPLTVEQQSHLENLLLAYWREKKEFSAHVTMETILQELRADPQAGELLKHLENWLHRRPGARTDPAPSTFLKAYGSHG